MLEELRWTRHGQYVLVSRCDSGVRRLEEPSCCTRTACDVINRVRRLLETPKDFGRPRDPDSGVPKDYGVDSEDNILECLKLMERGIAELAYQRMQLPDIFIEDFFSIEFRLRAGHWKPETDQAVFDKLVNNITSMAAEAFSMTEAMARDWRLAHVDRTFNGPAGIKL
jgi:hypothetical protein